ncbi:unnamed protein product, partial [Didymodactylos carnosus]
MTTTNKPVLSIKEHLRLFTNWIMKKVIERDLVKMLSCQITNNKSRTQTVLEITKHDKLSTETLKDIISSFENLYMEQEFDFLKSSISMYAIIRFNREFDILSSITQLDDLKLTSQQRILKSNLLIVHNKLFRKDMYLSEENLDNLFINNKESSKTLKEYLKLRDDEFTFENILKKLYHLQKTDINFKFLQSVPEFFFVYYVFPHYNLQNGAFYLEEKQMTNNSSSTTTTATITTASCTTTTGTSSSTRTTPRPSSRINSPIINSSISDRLSPSPSSSHRRSTSLPTANRLLVLTPRPDHQTTINTNDNDFDLDNDDNDEEINNEEGQQQINEINDNNNLKQKQTILNNYNVDDDNDEELAQCLHQLRHDMYGDIPFTVRRSSPSRPSSTIHQNSTTHRILSQRHRPSTLISTNTDRIKTFSSSSTNTDPIDPSHINQFEELHLKFKYTSLKLELDWIEMSTIDTDKTKSKYVTSCQQTQLSGTSKIIFTTNTIRNDIPPETIFKNELHRKKRYENHLAILNLHKERNSYPSALSSMPQPTIGNDDNDFIKEWNELLNDSRRNLMNKTIEYIENNLIEIN